MVEIFNHNNFECFVSWVLQVMYMDHRKERIEMLKELLAKKVEANPLHVLNQVTQMHPFFLIHNINNNNDNNSNGDRNNNNK